PFAAVTGAPQLSTIRTDSVAGCKRATLEPASVRAVGRTEILLGVQPPAARSPSFAGFKPGAVITLSTLTVRSDPSVKISVTAARCMPGWSPLKCGLTIDFTRWLGMTVEFMGRSFSQSPPERYVALDPKLVASGLGFETCTDCDPGLA